jgi:type IV pilus assembly protein PilO
MNIREPATQKIIIAAILSLGLAFGFFFTRALPITYPARAAKMAETQAELARVSSDVAKARAAVANLPALERECNEVHQRWELMSEMLPTSKEIAALLTQVTLAGQQSGVEFAIFKPGAPRQEDFYAVYPTQVRVEGAYHAVGRFMAEIANLSRIVNFVDLNFAAADEPTRDRTVVAGFTAEAYAFQDRPVATQPSAEEAKAGAKGAKSAKAKSASNSKASAKKPGEAK